MKKIVRKVWIGALSGLAFLGACCSQKGLSRSERRQLTKERDAIQQMLTEKMNADCGDCLTEELIAHKSEIYSLQNKLDSINYRLGDSIDLDRNVRRRELQFQLDSLSATLKEMEGARVYGSPEVIERRHDRMMHLEAEIDSVRRQLEEFDNEPPTPLPKDTYEALYGVPVPDPTPLQE